MKDTRTMKRGEQRDLAVHDSVLAAAAADPDRPAIVTPDATRSYGDLDRASAVLASRLRGLGVGPGTLVAVALSPGQLTPVAILAVLRAGGAYVPMDPAYPTDRLRWMLEASRAPVLLTTPELAGGLPRGEARVVELTEGALKGGDGAAHTDRPPLSPEQPAYVIFTSGSTGRPKGVMVPHRGLRNLVDGQISGFGIHADSRVLQFAPLSFDASVSEVFTALAAGAALCLAPRDDLLPGRLVETVRRMGVTVATLPPSALALLDPDDFPTLATVVSAGEACSAQLVARWAPGRRFINAYGPTEVSVCATMQRCDAGDPRPPAIGAPLPNVSVYVLDDAMAEVGPGGSGELFVGGAGVALGYLDRPGLTAERFLPDPFGGRAGARLYRTGDLVRVRDDHSLEFLGRADHQVKLRGYRIELSEVESVVREADSVRDALVMVREDRPGDQRLVAYLVAPAGGDAAARALAAQRLPAFMRPTDYVILDRFPSAPSGKVDRARLPAPGAARSGPARLPARSELEYALVELWRDLLGLESVGVDEDFFTLGGHSVLAIKLLARIRDELGCDLPLSLLVERRTVAGLAAAVAEEGAAPPVRSPVLLRDGDAGAPLFLAPPVHGSGLCYLPLVERLPPGRPIYSFSAPGLDGRRDAIGDIEELAAHYIEELVAIQPRGPYLVGGWSMGGCVALAMALQLVAAGQDVPALFVIDATLPSEELRAAATARWGRVDDAWIAAIYVRNFGRCFGVAIEADHARYRELAPADRARRVLDDLRQVPTFPPDLGVEQLLPRLEVFAAIFRGFGAWRPTGRYGGRAALFQARDGHPLFNKERGDWQSYLERPTEVHPVDGNHFSVVFEPHVDSLAAALAGVLEEVP